MKYIAAASGWIIVGFFVGAFVTAYLAQRDEIAFMRTCWASGAKEIVATVINHNEQVVQCSYLPKEAK